MARKIRAQSPDERENEMIALAVDRAEQQLIDGTASAQVIVHYLKLATSKEKMEKEKMEEEIKLLRAKTESLQAARRVDELYSEALNAMRTYSGNRGDHGYD